MGKHGVSAATCVFGRSARGFGGSASVFLLALPLCFGMPSSSARGVRGSARGCGQP